MAKILTETGLTKLITKVKEADATKVNNPQNNTILTTGSTTPANDADYQKIQSSATTNDFAKFNANGQVVDSGLDESDFIIADAQAVHKIVDSAVISPQTNILQKEITVNNKLDADLVADTNSTNKFTTAAEKATWNAKEDSSNKTTILSSESTNIQYPAAKTVYDELVNIKEIAEGKTSTFVSNITKTPAFNTQDATVEVASFTTINDVVISSTNSKIGDNVFITDTEVPDRWISNITTQNNLVLSKLETAKVPVTDVQFNSSSVVVNKVATIPYNLSSYNDDISDVKFTSQTLTSEQKTQARNNICASGIFTYTILGDSD